MADIVLTDEAQNFLLEIVEKSTRKRNGDSMEEFVGLTDEQLASLIRPVSDGLGKNGFSAESNPVAIALLAQMVLEYRKNRAMLTGGFDFGDFGKRISTALDALFPATAPSADAPNASDAQAGNSDASSADVHVLTPEEIEKAKQIEEQRHFNPSIERPKIVSKTRDE